MPGQPVDGRQAVEGRLLDQRSNDRVDDAVGPEAHLIVGRVLNRVRDKDPPRLLEPERLRLVARRIHERARGDRDRGTAAGLEPGYVVHTARRAASSVGQRLDYVGALEKNRPAQIIGRRLGERRLAIAP